MLAGPLRTHQHLSMPQCTREWYVLHMLGNAYHEFLASCFYTTWDAQTSGFRMFEPFWTLFGPLKRRESVESQKAIWDLKGSQRCHSSQTFGCSDNCLQPGLGPFCPPLVSRKYQTPFDLGHFQIKTGSNRVRNAFFHE